MSAACPRCKASVEVKPGAALLACGRCGHRFALSAAAPARRGAWRRLRAALAAGWRPAFRTDPREPDWVAPPTTGGGMILGAIGAVMAIFGGLGCVAATDSALGAIQSGMVMIAGCVLWAGSANFTMVPNPRREDRKERKR